jgi:hypothetical protein
METKEAAREREFRHILRQVQDHLLEMHVRLGAKRESVGMVDVLHHPESTVPTLNYVTPRRNTAWVSAGMVRQGLEYLRQQKRLPRVQYVEGLYPPQFSKSLRDLGLFVERETPLLVYRPAGIHGKFPPSVVDIDVQESTHVQEVEGQRAMEHWWYVWRNAHYDVLTLGVEPLLVGREMGNHFGGHQKDLVVYRHGFPVGVSRISLFGRTANLLALAILKEARTPALMQLLMLSSIKIALMYGADTIFAPGEDSGGRRVARKLGFMDFGSIVCHAASEKNDEYGLDLPVLAV